MTRDVIRVREAKRLAAKLHRANGFVVDAKRTRDPGKLERYTTEASNLIGEVIGTLMDMHGQTDFYGNPTASTGSCEVGECTSEANACEFQCGAFHCATHPHII